MGIIQQFKEFAMKGNVIDMAVGIIIGAGFGKIVASLVKDVIMPPFGLALGNVDFSSLYFNLSGGTYASLAAAQAAGAVTINYGLFINTLIEFIIVAFALFMLISQINKLKKEAPPPAPNTRECPFCASNISKKALKCPNCTSDLGGK